jgi:hypothetical protein
MPLAYEEMIDFLAGGTTPAGLIAFQPSDATKSRVESLLGLQRTRKLSREEQEELDHYLQLEHILRMAKIKARRQIDSV